MCARQRGNCREIDLWPWRRCCPRPRSPRRRRPGVARDRRLVEGIRARHRRTRLAPRPLRPHGRRVRARWRRGDRGPVQAVVQGGLGGARDSATDRAVDRTPGITADGRRRTPGPAPSGRLCRPLSGPGGRRARAPHLSRRPGTRAARARSGRGPAPSRDPERRDGPLARVLLACLGPRRSRRRRCGSRRSPRRRRGASFLCTDRRARSTCRRSRRSRSGHALWSDSTAGSPISRRRRAGRSVSKACTSCTDRPTRGTPARPAPASTMARAPPAGPATASTVPFGGPCLDADVHTVLEALG